MPKLIITNYELPKVMFSLTLPLTFSQMAHHSDTKLQHHLIWASLPKSIPLIVARLAGAEPVAIVVKLHNVRPLGWFLRLSCSVVERAFSQGCSNDGEDHVSLREKQIVEFCRALAGKNTIIIVHESNGVEPDLRAAGFKERGFRTLMPLRLRNAPPLNFDVPIPDLGYDPKNPGTLVFPPPHVREPDEVWIPSSLLHLLPCVD